MKHSMRFGSWRLALFGAIVVMFIFGANASGAPVALPFDSGFMILEPETMPADAGRNLDDPGDVVDFGAALIAAGDYLKQFQADGVVGDNAGNGPEGSESPDDPDDGGWDWRLNWDSDAHFHSVNASSTNLYGVTALGLYYAYLATNDATYWTALLDAASNMVANSDIRSGSDLKFLMLFDDLYDSVESPTSTYEDAAKAKYDARIATYGSAGEFARYIRDTRHGQGYDNGIIAWDIGIWAVDAQMLYDRFGLTYDADADSMAEVLWQDSFNDNPGYFDVDDDDGWDPDYNNTDYYWYTLGITGLIDAFNYSGSYTSDLSGLITILLNCQYTTGAFSYCYGANTDDEDWQSTAYAAMTLKDYDAATYSDEIQHAAYWTAATQHSGGGWIYGSGNHYPEVSGESACAVSFGSNPDEVWVNDDWTSQADVDAYNTSNGTNYVWGYDAFGNIQDGIDGVEGSTVHVLEGMYYQSLNITMNNLSIIGAGESLVTINVTGLAGYDNSGIYITANGVTLQGFTLQSDGSNPPRYGIKFGTVDGGTLQNVTVQNMYRSGVDMLGASNLNITNVTCLNNGGNGIQAVDAHNITFTNITTSGNAWGSLGVMVWGRYTSRGTDDIVIQGNCSFGEMATGGQSVYLESGDWSNPTVPGTITFSTDPLDDAQVTLTSGDCNYAFSGPQEVESGYTMWRAHMYETLAQAQTVAQYGPLAFHTLGNDRYIRTVTDYAGPRDFYVYGYGDPNYMSIQAAVDAAESGDLIHVAAGIYEEALLVEKPLTMLGATAGVNKNGYTVPGGYNWDDAVETIIMHPDPGSGYTTIVDIHDTDDVIFDGFIVQELSAVGNLNSSLLRVYAHSRVISSIQVKNCIIGPNTNTVSQDGTHGRMGLYIVNHPYDENGVTYSTISHNKVFDCKGNGDNIFIWSSYYAYGAPGPASMVGTVIEDNEIYGAHRSGIETAGGYSDLVIRDNVIYGNSELPGDDVAKLKYGHGIQLIRGSSDKVSDPLTAYGPVNLTIEGNDIYDNSKCGIYMGPKNDQISIVNNTIRNNGWDGVMVDLAGNYWNPQFEDPPASEEYACYDCSNDVAASDNSIYGNGTASNPDAEFAVHVNGTPTNGFVLDASGNWLGTAVPSSVDVLIEGAVDYSPWTANDGTYESPGFTGDFSELWVDDNSPKAGAEDHIQEGIDMVTASTVNVAAGVYTAVSSAIAVIDKPLNLVGAGQTDDAFGTILEGGAYGAGEDATGLGNGWPRAIVVQSNDVTIRNMRIREYQGNQTTVGGYAIVARAETAWGVPVGPIDNLLVEDITFEDCHYGVRGKDITDLLIQRTIFQQDDGVTDYAQYISTSVNTIIRENTVANGSIWVTDAVDALIGGPNTTDGNVITDATYNGIWLGQQFAAGTSSGGTIQNNTVNGAWEGGIVVWNWPGELVDGIQILDNYVTGAEANTDPHGGIAIWQGDFTNMLISGNTLAGNLRNGVDNSTSANVWDANCYGDFSSNPGFPTTYQVDGSGDKIDLNPNKNGCGNVDFIVTSDYMGCEAGCLGDTLYLTFDQIGYITGQIFVQLPAQLDADWAAGTDFQDVMPASNAAPNLNFAAARRSAGNQIEVNVSWAPPYSDGDGTKYIACLPIKNVSATGGETLAIAGVTSTFYNTGGAHVDEFALSTATIYVDCEAPAATIVYDPALTCDGFGTAGQLEETIKIDVLRGTTPPNSPLESGYVEVNGNGAQQITLFGSLLPGDYGTTTFPSTADAATIWGWLNEGCNELIVHAFDTECNEGVSAALNVTKDTTPPTLTVNNTPVCYNDFPTSPQYGGSTLDDNLDITTVINPTSLAAGCFAQTGTIEITYLTGPAFSLPLDVANYPADDTEALALWTWIVSTSGVPGTADGENYTFDVEACDCAGNCSSGSFTICIDLTAPVNTFTEFDARPTDMGVWLKWDWNYDAAQATVMEIWRSPDSGEYPAYASQLWADLSDNANYPVSYPPAGWTLVTTQDGFVATTSGAHPGTHSTTDPNYWEDADPSWVDESEDRDVYRYVTFVKDAGGNWSQVAGPSYYALNVNADRSTNYWLGDYSRDATTDPNGSSGTVNTADLSLLSGVYFTAVPPTPAFYDIGPEDAENGIGKGNPTPDGSIDFFDLVPFSFNFGTTGPSTFSLDPDFREVPSFRNLDETPAVVISVVGEMPSEVGDQFTIALSMTGNDLNAVKVVEAELGFDESIVEFESAVVGNVEVYEGIPWATAKNAVNRKGTLVAAAAALGEQATIKGNPMLGTFTLRWIGEHVGITELGLRNVRFSDGHAEVVSGEGYSLSVQADGVIPHSFMLYQNYPNPFNPSTQIQFDLAEHAYTRLVIYNLLGREVRTLIASQLQPGEYRSMWDGCDNSGSLVTSGIYVYRLTAGDFVASRKMMLAR